MPEKDGRMTPEERAELERKLAEAKRHEDASRYYPSDIYKPGPPPEPRTEQQTRQVPPPEDTDK
jgi:hypothetical protein